MSKCNLESLVLKHSEEISELKSSTTSMMMLWKITGAVTLAAFAATCVAVLDYLIRVALL